MSLLHALHGLFQAQMLCAMWHHARAVLTAEAPRGLLEPLVPRAEPEQYDTRVLLKCSFMWTWQPPYMPASAVRLWFSLRFCVSCGSECGRPLRIGSSKANENTIGMHSRASIISRVISTKYRLWCMQRHVFWALMRFSGSR